MFEQFKYDIHQLQDEYVTKENITTLMEQISEHLRQYKGKQEKKVIIFAFSGHGTSRGSYEDQIFANDGELWLKKDIVLKLVKHPNISEIPKLFFIDACRGEAALKYKNKLGEKGFAEVDTNYWIEYGSIPDPKSSRSGHESEWMPTLAMKLRERDDTLENVVEEVNTSIYKKQKSNAEKSRLQQLCRLHTGALKLYHSGMSKT